MLYRLDRSGIVKVADFGLAEDMYAINYYHQGKSSDDVETKVPIRWMPLESIEEGLFNEKSDVVSHFRITVRIIFKNIYLEFLEYLREIYYNYIQQSYVYIVHNYCIESSRREEGRVPRGEYMYTSTLSHYCGDII